jgi:hypothetical protein
MVEGYPFAYAVIMNQAGRNWLRLAHIEFIGGMIDR